MLRNNYLSAGTIDASGKMLLWHYRREAAILSQAGGCILLTICQSMPERLFEIKKVYFCDTQLGFSSQYCLYFSLQVSSVKKAFFFPLDDIDAATEQGVYLEEKPNSHRSSK